MSEQGEKEAIASLLLDHVNKGDVVKVEACLGQFHNDCRWREIVRYEFPIEQLMSNNLRYDMIIPRLLAYEIVTLSPFHYAALRGINDIIVNFIDHDIPVDVALSVGTTALHMAAFSGKYDCVKMLVDVYKADINKQDRYGWTALHYASTEGHYEVVELLVTSGATASLRDQDGTSAAFRAQVNGYTDIVEFLCRGDPDVLQVSTAYSAAKTTDPSPEALYSQVWVNKHKNPIDKPGDVKQRSATMVRKSPQKPDIQPKPDFPAAEMRKYDTLPKNFKENRRSSIRRLIQKEMESIEVGEPDYMDPTGMLHDGDQDPMLLAGVGVNTLKGVIREELGKYTKRLLSKSNSISSADPIQEEFPYNLGPAPKPPLRNDYEDIYEVVKFAPPAATSSSSSFEQTDGTSVPAREAPPLPPRNQPSVLDLHQDQDEDDEDDEDYEVNGVLKLKRTSLECRTDSKALSECIGRIAKVIGRDWRKLAVALSIEKTQSKTEERIELIAKRHPGNDEKQAAVALSEWRINKGPSAELDDLTIALRKSGLKYLIPEVDRVTQEFTA